MMNYSLENLNEIIEEVLIEFCETYPIPDFTKEDHLNHLRSVLEQMSFDVFSSDEIFEAISLAPKKFTLEAPLKKKSAVVKPEDKVKIDAHKKGLEGKGGNAYGPKDRDIITYRNQNGRLVPVNPPQKIGKAKTQSVSPTKNKLARPAIKPKTRPVAKPTAKPIQKPQVKPVAKPTVKPSQKKSEIPVSFAAAFMKNSRQPEAKREAELAKKIELAKKAIEKAALKGGGKKGVYKLETAEGSGKFIEVKVKDVQIAVSNLMSGKKLSALDKKLLKLTTKIVTNPDNGDVKLYFSQKIAGRHPQQGYQSADLATKNFTLANDLRSFALKAGLNVGKSSEGAIGKKVLTPLKLANNINRAKPIEKVKIQKNKEGIVFGNKQIKYKKAPDHTKLTKYFIQQGLSKTDAEKRASTVINQINAWNGKIDDLYDVAKKSQNDLVDFNSFGKVDTPQERRKTRTNIHKGVKLLFLQELKKFGDAFGQKNLANKPENKPIFASLDKLDTLNAKYDLEKDEKARAAYKSELDNLIINLANSPDFKDAVADFTEIKAGLQFLSEGRQVLFPASENFQTADIIILPDDAGWKDSGAKSYEEYLAKNFQFLAVSLEYVGGLSVKFKGGGGSANYNKIIQSVYKNNETQQRLVSIQKTYKIAYSNQQKINSKEVDAAEKEINDTLKWAIKNKIISQADADAIRKIGLEQAANEIKANPNAGNCGGKENQKQLRRAIGLQHIQLHLTAVINNNDVLYTRYGNFNEKLAMKGGKASQVKDDIVDGVIRPCYMSPHHNPGYTQSVDNDGCEGFTPTNQNPSHIKSEKPELVKNFKGEE
jgi:hypothetical protein